MAFRKMLFQGGGVGLASTLYVDPAGSDATGARGSTIQRFKTIQAAINAAQAGDTIHVANGTYTENLTVKSDVEVRGESRQGVIINGNVTWTPNGAGDEIPRWRSLTITGSMTMDATLKTGGLAYFVFSDASAGFAGSVGRAGQNVDGFYLTNINLPENDGARWQLEVTDGVFIADNAEVAEVFAQGDALVSLRRTIVYGDVQHDGSGSPSMLYCEVNGNVLLENPTGSGPFAEARRTIFYGNVNVTQAVTYDTYDCTFLGLVGNIGLGSVNRNDGEFVGANGVDPGRAGLVPAPSASHNTRYLRGDGNWAALSLPSDLSTTTSDATPTQIYSQALATDTTYAVEASIIALSSDGTKRALFKRRAMVYRLGLGAVLDGTTQVVGTDANADGLNAAFDVNGNNVRLMVTGLAATNLDWRARVEPIQSVFAGPS